MLLSIVWDCVEGQETMQIFRKKQHVKSSNQKLTDAGKDLGRLSNGLATKKERKQQFIQKNVNWTTNHLKNMVANCLS